VLVVVLDVVPSGRVAHVRDLHAGGGGELGHGDGFAVSEQPHGRAHQVPTGLLIGA
jgi:hypothetical protein